jgi:hypothetical protein
MAEKQWWSFICDDLIQTRAASLAYYSLNTKAIISFLVYCNVRSTDKLLWAVATWTFKMYSSSSLERTSLRIDVGQEQHIHDVFINKYVGGSVPKSKYCTHTLVPRHCLWFGVQHECGCYPMLRCTVTWLHTTWHGHARTHPIQPPSWRDGLHRTRLFDGHDAAWGMTGRKSPHPFAQKWHMKFSRLSCKV